MKKIIKILTVVAIMGIFCMLFCGCDMLDEMKAKHGTISEDLQKVELGDKTFVRLCDDVPYYFNNSYYNQCYVTTEDVPVLLSENYGSPSYYDRLNGILAVSKNDVEIEINPYLSSLSYPISTDTYMFFCEEERYEAYAGISMEDADRIGFDDYSEDYMTAIFSSKASNEIFSHVKDGGNWNKDIYEDVMMNSVNVISPIYNCNKELTIKDTLDGYEIYIMENDDVYLSNYYGSKVVKLSDETAEAITTEYYDY